MSPPHISIPHLFSKSTNRYKNLGKFSYVITLCGDALDSCPIFPSHVRNEHWPLGDPAKTTGEPSDLIKVFRIIRYQIEVRVRNFLQQIEGA